MLLVETPEEPNSQILVLDRSWSKLLDLRLQAQRTEELREFFIQGGVQLKALMSNYALLMAKLEHSHAVGSFDNRMQLSNQVLELLDILDFKTLPQVPLPTRQNPRRITNPEALRLEQSQLERRVLEWKKQLQRYRVLVETLRPLNESKAIPAPIAVKRLEKLARSLPLMIDRALEQSKISEEGLIRAADITPEFLSELRKGRGFVPENLKNIFIVMGIVSSEADIVIHQFLGAKARNENSELEQSLYAVRNLVPSENPNRMRLERRLGVMARQWRDLGGAEANNSEATHVRLRTLMANYVVVVNDLKMSHQLSKVDVNANLLALSHHLLRLLEKPNFENLAEPYKQIVREHIAEVFDFIPWTERMIARQMDRLSLYLPSMIREAREERGISVDLLAERTQSTVKQIKDFENGLGFHMENVPQIFRLIEFLNFDFDISLR